MWRKHDYFLSETNKLIGSYKIRISPVGRQIEFTPINGTHVKDAIRALIDISNKHKLHAYATFFNIRIDVPYPTDMNEETIKNIVNTYRKNYELRASAVKSHYVRS